MISAILFISFFIFLILGVPIGICLGLSSVCAILYSGTSLTIVATNMYSGISKFLLLAIPFFVLSGNIMAKAGISKRLIKFVDTCVGHKKGGIAIVCVIVACFFGAISGSGPATAAAIGGIMIGAMVSQGYSKGYSGALIAAGSTIGPVIPPSIPMIMYGVTIGVSVSYMFIAGIIPGILMGVALMIYNYFTSKKRGYKGRETQAKTAAEKAKVLKDAIPAILMPIIILGGIYSGVFTPTESAVIGVVYSIIVAVFVYHQLTWKRFCQAMFDATITSATIMVLFGAANTFGRILTMNSVPTMVTHLQRH